MSEYPMPHNSIDLSGQVALVTGASSGLGWRFARVLAAAGASVAIAGRRESRLEELQALIAEEGGVCAPFVLDMTDSEAVLRVVGKVEDQLGPVTILVNNAGVPDAQMAMKMPMELIDRVLDTNVKGPFVLACEVARRLKANELPGRIVNIASVAANTYNGNGAALYSTSKAAVVRMTETLAIEWARFNINVNAISPGVFESEMSDGMIERMGDLASHFPRKRVGHPAQLDSTLLYLCSPASDCVTGSNIVVDDGQTPR